MRAIKFRAWNRELGEMWVGGYVQFDTGNVWFENEDGDQFEYTQDKFPLMQYTGLRDKNGNEIYEGDILEYHDYMWNFKADQIHIGVVRWQDWHGAFDCERRMIDGKEVKPEHGLPGIQFKFQAKVIGNIYENPHLLKGVADEGVTGGTVK